MCSHRKNEDGARNGSVFFRYLSSMKQRSKEYQNLIEGYSKRIQELLSEKIVAETKEEYETKFQARASQIEDLNQKIKETQDEWGRDIKSWTSISSTALTDVCYDKDNKILSIRFARGEVYDYVDVDREVFEALLDTDELGDSVGKYFRTHIRDQYNTSRK